MNVLFRSDAGPLEGFEEASFRVAVNDDGIGQLVAPPDVIAAIVGPVVCSVDGVDVFSWRPEDRSRQVVDREVVTVSGRGLTAGLERAIVLPAGYPAYTVRTRTLIGAPFAIWSALLAEAQSRGRVTSISPTWTNTEDSKGAPWTETIKAQLDPGANLRQLLTEMSQVEGAEWVPRPNGSLEAAPMVGTDRSAEVVLFIGGDQLELNKTSSDRNKRQTVYLEASTGVSEVTNSAGVDAGEIWLEGQDFADPLTRPVVAAKLANQMEQAEEEVGVAVRPDAGAFSRFDVGDLISVDTGEASPEVARVVGIAVKVASSGLSIELTLFSEVQLRQQKIDNAIEAKADVKLAASTTLQRRHGLVTADKFLSGAVGTDVAIASENYDPGLDGWAILGNGNAEFNDAVFRGDLQSDNYVPGVSGWALDRTGNAEFYSATIRGDLQSSNFVSGTSGWQLLDSGAVEFDEGTFRGDIVGGTISIGTDAFNVDATGRLFAGSDSFATAPLKIDSNGSLSATGVVITGGTVRTGATGQRIEMRSVGTFGFPSLEFYNSSGEDIVRMTSVLDNQLQVAVGTNKRITFIGNGGSFQLRDDGRIELNGSLIGGVSQVSLNPNTGSMSVAGNFFAGGGVSGGSLSSSGGVIANGTIETSGSVTAGATLSVGSSATLNGNVTFRNTGSGRRFAMNQSGSGSAGSEPTLDTSGDQFGFVGIPGRRMFRMHAGAFLTSSESRLKGELVDADLARCYDAVRSMRLTSYALHRDRDDYYGAKGEWMMGDRDDFVDRGGPLRKLGIIAEEAPDDVADETHQNVDVYAYASLIAGAVKALQLRVETMEQTGVGQ